MVWIALSGVEHPGNLGAVARVMGNFGFRKLLLLDPACSPNDPVARRLAKHAQSILEDAKVSGWDELRRFDLVIGTTAQLGTDYNLPRSPLLPEELAARLGSANLRRKRVALLFGPEGPGLTNAQLLDCDLAVTIPASRKYGTLNLSHAVAILLYELSREKHGKRVKGGYPLATAREKEVALGLVDDILPRLGLARGMKEETQRRLWKRMLGKALLTRREMAALLGFLRKVRRNLE